MPHEFLDKHRSIVIRDDPRGRVSRGGVLRQARHGRNGRSLVRSAEQDAGPVRDKCLRRREPKTAAAAGDEVNPVAQSKIHPAILPVWGLHRAAGAVTQIQATASAPVGQAG